VAEIRYVETIDVAAPIEKVYAYRLDFTHLPEYNPNVSNLRAVPTDAIAEYLFDLTLPGAEETIESPLRVVKAEPPFRFEYETGPAFMARGDCEFERVGDGTRIHLGYTLNFPGELDEEVRSVVESSGREQSKLELENIKRLLEYGA
jgi:uncharacterized membrane protein